jgi:hypothetical protein
MKSVLTPFDVLVAIKANAGSITAPQLQKFFSINHIVFTQEYCKKKLRELERKGILTGAGVDEKGFHKCYWSLMDNRSLNSRSLGFKK